MAPLLAHKPGVDRAFERLYRRHALDVYRYAYGVLRNQADAEDVTQTTFMNAYRALERGETPESPQNWLIAIAHNVCRQRWRQASRRVQEVGLDIDVADTLVGAEDDEAPSPEDIKRALGHLAFNQRSALVMRELEGRSYAEIADLLGLSVSAVETLIFRARRALREQLEGSLTCGEAEQYLSRQLDGQLARAERSQLRAHLRECAECRKLARRQRAQRSALRSLGAIPLPSSLASLFGGGGAAVAAKVATAVVATGVVGGLSYQADQMLAPAKPTHVAHHVATTGKRPKPLVPIAAVAVPAQRSARPHAPALSARRDHGATVRPHTHPAPPRVDEAPQAVAAPPPPQRADHPGSGRGENSAASGRAAEPNAHGNGERQAQHGQSGSHGSGQGRGGGTAGASPKAGVPVHAPPVEVPPVHTPPTHGPPVRTPPVDTVPVVTVPETPVTVPAPPAGPGPPGH